MKYLFSPRQPPLPGVFFFQRAGFTLIELMVVTAIIGALITLAYPTFTKWQARSRSAEVQLSLALAHKAEATSLVVNQSYSICLHGIGFAREGQRFFYTIGFSNGANSNQCGPDGAQTCLASRWVINTTNGNWTVNASETCTDGQPNVSIFLANQKTGFATTISGNLGFASLPSVAGQPERVTTQNQFTVFGIGNIYQDQIDQWSIDHRRNLQNLQSGVR